MAVRRQARSTQPCVPVVQWPRTPPFHGGNTGSNPVGDANKIKHLAHIPNSTAGPKRSNNEINPELTYSCEKRAVYFALCVALYVRDRLRIEVEGTLLFACRMSSWTVFTSSPCDLRIVSTWTCSSITSGSTASRCRAEGRRVQTGVRRQAEFYLAAVNRTMRTSVEGPTIGVLLCETRSGPIVEFALENNTQPIGVATYTVTRELPASVRDELPTVEASKRSLPS
jgi:hypothetical protein